MSNRWTVEVWSGAGWVRVCTESNEVNGRAALREMREYEPNSAFRLVEPDGSSFAIRERAMQAAFREV